MGRKLVVAPVATHIPDDVARGHYRGAVGHEIECGAGVVCAQVISSETARAVNTDRIGGGWVEPGSFGLERIGILAGPDRDRSTARIRSGLIGGRYYRTGCCPRNIADVLLLPMRNLGGEEAQGDRAWRVHAGRIERKTCRIGDSVGRCNRSVSRDG